MSVDFSVMNAPLLTAYAETVVYTPRVGDARSISAVVDRQPIQPLSETPQGLRPLVPVHVANDAITGIAAADLDTGGDTLTFPERIGGADKVWPIARLAGQDDAMLLLECR